MKEKYVIIKGLLILLLLVICFFIGRLTLRNSIETRLESISNYYKQDSINLVISNIARDGSEQLPKALPTEISQDVDYLMSLIKIYCGFESRIYVYVDNDTSHHLLIKIETSKAWKESLFFFNKLNWTYTPDDKYVDELLEKGGFQRVFGNILSVVPYDN